MPDLLWSILRVVGALEAAGDVRYILVIFLIAKRSTCTQSVLTHAEPDLKRENISHTIIG
jgi:hypothetical protein